MDLEKLKAYVGEKCKNTLIVMVTPDFKKSEFLADFFPNYMVICAYDAPRISELNANNEHIFPISKILKNSAATKAQSGSLIEPPAVQKHIRDFAETRTCKHIAILTFKGNSKIELVCKKNKWKPLNISMTLTTALENKANFEVLLKTYTQEKLPTISGVLKEISDAQIASLNSKKIVVQFTRGFGGSSTHFMTIPQLKKLQKTAQGTHKVKLTPYISGQTLTLNGCNYGNTTFISHPFVQKTGLKKYTRYEGGSYGIDFDTRRKKIPKEIIKKTVTAAHEIGEIARNAGHRGFFGLDFITDGRSVYPVEINPRLTANCHPFTANQLELKHIPFLVLHVMEFLNISIIIPNVKQFSQRMYSGQTTIVRNIGDAPCTVGKLSKNNALLKKISSDFRAILQKKVHASFNPFSKDSTIPPDFEWAEFWQL